MVIDSPDHQIWLAIGNMIFFHFAISAFHLGVTGEAQWCLLERPVRKSTVPALNHIHTVFYVCSGSGRKSLRHILTWLLTSDADMRTWSREEETKSLSFT